MACNFNIKLFQPFTSMKEKVTPQLADDWVISWVDEKSVLKSKKTNQAISDIYLTTIINFITKEDMTLKKLKIDGTFIVGKDRSLYNKSFYDEHMKKYNERFNIKEGDTKANLIAKKDWKILHTYKAPCGSKYIYAGTFYILKLISNRSKTKIGQLQKKHFYAIEKLTSLTHPAELFELPSNIKFSEDLGKNEVLQEDDLSLKLIRNSYNTKCLYISKEKETLLLKFEEYEMNDQKLLFQRKRQNETFKFWGKPYLKEPYYKSNMLRKNGNTLYYDYSSLFDFHDSLDLEIPINPDIKPYQLNIYNEKGERIG